MRPEPFVSRILDDEGLTTDLEGLEAELLVEWLVHRAERIAAAAKSEAAAWKQIEVLCKRARVISRFAALWNGPVDLGEAATLAQREGLPWPLPDGNSPREVLQQILDRERT
jgi:hypothetical protein